MNRWVAGVFMVGLAAAAPIAAAGPIAAAAPSAAAAQPAPPTADEFRIAQSKKPRGRAQPELDEEDQLSPRQLDQRAPARPVRPAEQPDQQEPAPPRPHRSAELPRTIVCNGVFGKESSHLKLATRFDSRN